MRTTVRGSQDRSEENVTPLPQYWTDDARLCAFCGESDPCWHGLPGKGWSTYLGHDRCPGCGWMDETVPLYIPGESLAA